MKPILITTAIVAAAGIAFVQHRRLSDLKEETARLEAVKPSPGSMRSDRSPPAGTPTQATPAQMELVLETLAEAFVSRQNGGTRPDPERLKQLYLAARNFSGKDIARLIGLLQNDPRLTGLDPKEIAQACHEIFSEAAPFAWKEFLKANRDLPDWQNFFDAAVATCLRADSKRALQEIEEETARGNRDFASSQIRSAALLKLAASDPDKMLANVLTPELTADPDALARLGGAVTSQFKKPEDHHRFMAALRRTTEKNPDSPLLQTIRKDYVGIMSDRLPGWPYESMQTLVHGEFTREEKLLVAEKASHRGDLDDRTKWADWFLGIDPAEWNRWIGGRPQQFEHPFVTLLGDWGLHDAAAASAWLEKMPPGDLRSEVVLEHASAIANRDPERAAGYLDELPESKGKRNLVKEIAKARR